MALTDAEYKQIADQLFLLKSPAPAKLLKPKTTDDVTFTAKFAPIAADPRFQDFGIGVVDFTADPANPKIWLHNGYKAYQTGSTGKIAILLAAVQLREDVRKVKGTGLVNTPEEFDELFKSGRLWKLANNSKSKLMQIAGEANAPRISTIFDFNVSPIDFIGAAVLAVPDKEKLRDGGDNRHYKWEHMPDLTFWERLYLAGARSDNVASVACMSEIGVAYVKAVQRAYGLYDPKNGMHFLWAGAYGEKRGVDTRTKVSRAADAKSFRQLTNIEKHYTEAFIPPFKPSGTRKIKILSWQPGSAAALIAYMIALTQDKFVNKVACDTIRSHLANGEVGTPPPPPSPPLPRRLTTACFLVEGVKKEVRLTPNQKLTKEHTKIGVLDFTKIEELILTALGYWEVEVVPSTGSGPPHILKHAAVAMVVKPETVGGPTVSAAKRAEELGKIIYKSLNP